MLVCQKGVFTFSETAFHINSIFAAALYILVAVNCQMNSRLSATTNRLGLRTVRFNARILS